MRAVVRCVLTVIVVAASVVAVPAGSSLPTGAGIRVDRRNSWRLACASLDRRPGSRERETFFGRALRRVEGDVRDARLDAAEVSRRLVEAGVPFVEVVMGDGVGWDTHRDNFPRVRALSQECDRAMSALVEDLQQRGLLDTTLVVWMGEFGRTPRINQGGGRDHWGRCWSVVVGGAVAGLRVLLRRRRGLASDAVSRSR